MTSAPFSIEYVGATWCAPCRTVKPLVVSLAQKFGIPLVVRDYDEMEEEEKTTVKKLPTVRILEGERLILLLETRHAETLEAWLKENMMRANGTDDF